MAITPADTKRCQAEITTPQDPFRIGSVKRTERCSGTPAFVVRERKPGADGERGEMSMCAACHVAFIEKVGGFVTRYELTPVSSG